MGRNAFDRYVEKQMASPSFAKAYEAARTEIETIDQLVRAMDAERASRGLSKAQLARRVGMEPSALRRLFTSPDSNPTFTTIAALLGELGLGLAVVPKRVGADASKRATKARSQASASRAGKTTRRAIARPTHP